MGLGVYRNNLKTFGTTVYGLTHPTIRHTTPGKILPKNILVFHIGLYVDIGVDIDSSLKDKKVFTYFDFFSNPR